MKRFAWDSPGPLVLLSILMGLAIGSFAYKSIVTLAVLAPLVLVLALLIKDQLVVGGFLALLSFGELAVLTPGLGISILPIVGALVIGVAVIKVALRKVAFPSLNSMGLLILLYLVSHEVSFLVSEHSSTSLYYNRVYWQIVIMCLSVVILVRNRNQVQSLLKVSALATGFRAFVGIFIALAKVNDGPLFWVLGIHGQQREVALLFALMLPVLLHFWLSAKTKTIWVIALCATLFGLILTGSRAGWVGGAVALMYMILRTKWRPSMRFVAVGGLVALVAVGVLFLGPELQERFDRTARELSGPIYSWGTGRVGIWLVTLRMLADNWLVGVGPGNLSYRFLSYMSNDVMIPELDYAGHNTYLTLAAEQGAISLLLFGAILARTLFALTKSAVRVEVDPLAKTVAASLFGWLVGSAFLDNHLDKFFWIFVIFSEVLVRTRATSPVASEAAKVPTSHKLTAQGGGCT